MKTLPRYLGLDYLRGGGTALLILLHAAIYGFAGYATLDMSQVPVYIMVLVLIGLWGGGYSMYSLVVNTARIVERRAGNIQFKDIGYIVLAGLIYLFVVATLQTLLFGRWDVFGDPPDYTLVPTLFRGLDTTLYFDKLLTGSGIKTVGLNLVIIPVVIYLVYRKRGLRDKTENYVFFLSIGMLMLFLSFTRILLYGDWVQARVNGDYLPSLLGSLFVADPYPGIAYLSYGFIGVALGMMLAYRRVDLLKKVVAPLAGLLIAIGVSGAVAQSISLFSVGWFWYFKLLAETGIFLIMFIVAIGLSLRQQNRRGRGGPSRWFAWIASLSRLSLTVYVLETTISEALRLGWNHVLPGWDNNMHLCVLFGVMNLMVWMVIAHSWARNGYRYSLENGWVRVFSWLGKPSTKVEIADFNGRPVR